MENLVVVPRTEDSYEKEKSIPLELSLLIDSYEKRIAELLHIIETLAPRQSIIPPTINNSAGPRLPSKGKISTTSELIAAMERRVRVVKESNV